jgi:hypothetical protein
MQGASVKWSRFNLQSSVFSLLISVFSFLFLVACGADAPVGTDGSIAVAEPFAAFYAANGDARFFGEPITEGFMAADNGRFTQYFQNMRLEYDEADSAVIIFPLGEWALAGVNAPKPAPVAANGRSRTFPETNLTVQDEFLSFYDLYNGERLLGYPISPQIEEGDLRVQYFVNGRLEWHPELGVDQRVQVGPLGRDHFLDVGVLMYSPIQAARPVSFAGIESVDMYTAVENPVLYSGDEQTLYITVFTPAQRPVDGIPVTVEIVYGETTAVLDPGTTDGQGRIVVPLNNLSIPPGQTVELLISAYSSDDRIIGQSTLTFQTWW